MPRRADASRKIGCLIRARANLLSFLWLGLVVVLPVGSIAQRAVVEGRVVASGSGRPLENAVVQLQDQTFAILDVAFSDARGAFRFQQFSRENPGGLFLVVEEEGFERASVRLDMRQLQGSFVIYLEPDQSREPAGRPAGDLVVDLGQLSTVIPDDAREEYERAVEDIERGRFEAAVERLERVVNLAPDYYDAWISLGVRQMDMGIYEDAERSFRAAEDSNPSGALAPLNLGILAYLRGEAADVARDEQNAGRFFTEAIRFLDRAVGLNPGSGRANFYAGAALYRLRDYDRAEVMLQTGLRLDASLADARLMLINVYVRQNRLEAALEQVEIFLTEQPESGQRPAIESMKAQIENALGR